jgi:hypothetical protein
VLQVVLPQLLLEELQVVLQQLLLEELAWQPMLQSLEAGGH